MTAPTTLDEARELIAWAEAQPILPVVGAPVASIEKHLEFLAATLPTRNVDTETGKRRFAVYVSILSGKSEAALVHMSRRACEALQWFPTPKQCLDFAAEHRAPPSPRSVALRLARQFTHDRFEEWIASLPNATRLDPSLPDQWLRIAVERGHLRQLDDGAFVIRARYHGPLMAYRG